MLHRCIAAAGPPFLQLPSASIVLLLLQVIGSPWAHYDDRVEAMLGMDAVRVVESLLRTSTRMPIKYENMKTQVHCRAGGLACSPLMGCAG